MTLYYPPTQNGLQKTLDAQLDQGHTAAATLNNTTGIQNKKGMMLINRIDTDGNEKSPSLREFISFDGTSGSTVTTLTRGLGGTTDQDHAVGSVVEFIWDVVAYEALLSAFTSQHSVAGAHTAASDSAAGVVELATTAETETGTDASRAVTPDGLHDMTTLAGAAWFLDEDTMSSNSDVKVPSQQSVKAYVDASLVAASTDGWIESADTWTYASSTSFTISGVDRTAIFKKGTKIKLTQSTDKFFYVTSSSFSTNTTVNITGGTDYTLANATITAPHYSYADTPQGFPQWFAYTSTPTWNGTPPSTNTVTNAQFSISGGVCFLRIWHNNSSAGTSNTQLAFTGPIACGDTAGTYHTSATGYVSTGESSSAPTASARAFVYSTDPTLYLFFSSISAKSAFFSGFYKI